MPFIAIHGQFMPEVGTPDGDSVRFKAKNKAHWAKLEGRPPKLSTAEKGKDSVQLRLEGIDSMEKAAQQPLAGQATASLLKRLGYKAGQQATPAGYILARMTDDKSGRPIAFAFAGPCPHADGSDVRLTPAMLRKSLNHQQAAAGHAYPLYYNTLFADLREELNKAVAKARTAKAGLWASDKTNQGVTFKGKESLAVIDPVWPKLWRRLESFAAKGLPLSQFVAFLEAENERLDVLDVMEERGLQDVVKVKGQTVRMTERPDNLRIRSAAGLRSKPSTSRKKP